MKKAYLFGAAALLILLIVVAYIASNRQKEEAVCPPQVVGPTAAPLVLVDDGPQNVARQLFADGEFLTDEEINERLEQLRNPGPPEVQHWRTDIDAEGGALPLPPLDEGEMMREFPGSLRKTPMGGPLPISPLLQSDICRLPYSPLTPFASYEPGEEESVSLASERTLIEMDAIHDEWMNWSIKQHRRRRLDEHLYLLQQQREMILALSPSSPLRRSFLREELLSASELRPQRLIDLSTGDPIDNPDLFDLFLQGK